MGWSLRLANALRLPTLGLIGCLVVLMVTSGFGGSSLTNRHLSIPAPTAAGASGFPTLQSNSALASLQRGEGPANAHPSSLPVSPGGYGWTNITSAVTGAPSGRLTSMTWDASDGYVLLWGWDSLSGFLRDTWTYQNGTWSNITSSVGSSPPAALYTVLAYDPGSQRVVMYSGENNSTWTYHDKVWSNITSTAGTHPPSLILESFVTDTTDQEAVLFGGQSIFGGSPFPHYTWVFKNGAWTNHSSTSPFNFGRISLPLLSDDPAAHGVLAVGLAEWQNFTPFLYRPATFLFTGGTWTNLTPTLPLEPVMSEAATMGYLPSISAVVYIAPDSLNSTGSFADFSGATWEFAGGVWTNVTSVTGPQPDTGVIIAGAVDPGNGTMLLFGGERLVSPVVYPGTWIFSVAPTVTASVSRTSIDVGQSVVLTGAVSGGASPTTYSWNLGDGNGSTAQSGSHTYTHAGVYTATLTATDLTGRSGSGSVSLVVNPTLAVTASATPASPFNGTWVAFVSQASGGTSPYSYSWSLGDTTTGTASSFAHEYSAKGTYAVTLTVTDAVGATAPASFSVVVQQTPVVQPPPTHYVNSSGAVSFTSGTGLGLVIGILLLLVIVLVLAALLAMRRRSPPGPPPTTYYTSPPPSPGSVPPPGAGGPPYP